MEPRLAGAVSARGFTYETRLKAMDPKFFPTPQAWRQWLEKHHHRHSELLVGFYKKDSGKPSITWPESVDGALCFGWIDGVRRRIDDLRYSIRFTPRKTPSTWSVINIRRVDELARLGLMHPAGIAAFEARQEKRSAIYSFEQESVEFNAVQARRFKANRTAWKFFQSQPQSYRTPATWWVISAKREETREARLVKLIAVSEQGEKLPQYNRSRTAG
jgi:uncharacterized protein YdeI (YjbR/CyaY-like superfamily)